MFRTLSRSLVPVLGAAVLLAGCDDDLDLDGQNRVILQSGTAASTAIADAFLQASLASQVPLSAVEAIQVNVTRVSVLPAAGDPNVDAAWVPLNVPGGAVSVDLMNLPAGGVTLAAGDLDETATTFAGVRIFFEEPARITFDETVSVGPTTLAPGTYDLFIPSGAQTGIKVLDGFTITRAGEDVTVVFDQNASVRNIVMTGQGRLIMAPPVLGVSDED